MEQSHPERDPLSPDEFQKRLEAQYSETAQLVGGLAHEIKNPLSTIRLNMELLGEDFEDAESARDRRALKKIRLVQHECQRLQDLLEEFLTFARVRRAQLQPTDLNQVVENVLDLFAAKAEESGIEIIRYLDPDLPRVLVDRELFQSALLNLVINAQQAMPEGGQLVVRSTMHGTRAALHLIDTGCGMDDATASKIFEPFFSTKPGGSGLGLPTTARIVDAHGGQISIQSEVGRGTQFVIELPVPAQLGGGEEV